MNGSTECDGCTSPIDGGDVVVIGKAFVCRQCFARISEDLYRRAEVTLLSWRERRAVRAGKLRPPNIKPMGDS